MEGREGSRGLLLRDGKGKWKIMKWKGKREGREGGRRKGGKEPALPIKIVSAPLVLIRCAGEYGPGQAIHAHLPLSPIKSGLIWCTSAWEGAGDDAPKLLRKAGLASHW